MIGTYKRLKIRRDAGEIDGFTLIELLIVIVVLGILAAVVIFALGGVTSQSAKAACSADGATINTAVSAYNAQTGGNPTNLAALVPSYLASVPSNLTHYAFGYVAGVLLIEVPGTTAWAAAPANGGTLATGLAYVGPASTTAGCQAPALI